MREIIPTPAAHVAQVEVDLKALASKINSAHDAGDASVRRGLDHYRAAGEALIRARQECKRRKVKWLDWLAENVRVKKTHAYRYIQLAEQVPVTGTSDEQAEAWRRICGNDDSAPLADGLFLHHRGEATVSRFCAVFGGDRKEAVTDVKVFLETTQRDGRTARVSYTYPKQSPKPGVSPAPPGSDWRIACDHMTYVTVEAEGEVIYDSRSHVFCDMDRFDETAKRLLRQRDEGATCHGKIVEAPSVEAIADVDGDEEDAPKPDAVVQAKPEGEEDAPHDETPRPRQKRLREERPPGPPFEEVLFKYTGEVKGMAAVIGEVPEDALLLLGKKDPGLVEDLLAAIEHLKKVCEAARPAPAPRRKILEV